MDDSGDRDRPIGVVRPRLGISACLLGHEVRHDGGHKREDFLADVLAAHVEMESVCPEVEAGLGVPREPIRWEGDRLVGVESGRDLTDRMAGHAGTRLDGLERLGLSGYVFKSKSPSCGLGARGAFAVPARARLAPLPLAEETDLASADAREAFCAAVFTAARWRAAGHGGWTAARLAGFHGRHRLLALSRSEEAAGVLDDIASAPGGEAGPYLARLLLTLWPGPGRVDHVHALEHAADAVRQRLSSAEHRAWAEAVAAHAEGHTPLARPIGLLRRLALRHGARDLLDDAYLEPHPPALRLLDTIRLNGV